MPTRPIACRCGGTIGADRCDRCGRAKRRAPSAPRQSARRRGYDRTWERTRRDQLRRVPFCQDCAAQGFTIEPATDVHHVHKLSARPDLKHDRHNLRSLCHRCHSIRTARGE